MRRRRFRKNNNTGVNVLGIAAIVLAAIVAGFLLTEFVVYPVMLGVSGPVLEQKDDKSTNPDAGTDSATGDAQKQEPVGSGDKSQENASAQTQTPSNDGQPKQSGYCIQFGSFTTKAAAEVLLSQLTAGGIKASVLEKDGNFKVVGEIFSDKATAAAAMANVDRTIYSDIFVTNI